MNETLSDRLDTVKRINEINEEKEQIKYEKYYNKFEKYIIKEFKKAQKILGHRFSYKKQHERMYYFYFDINTTGSSSNNLVFYVCPESEKYTPLKEVYLEITSYCNHLINYDHDFFNNVQFKNFHKKIVEAIELAINKE